MKKLFLIICLLVLFQVSAFAGAPTCTSFSFTASTVGASLIQLQCSDPDGDPLTFAIAAGPSHGTTSGLNTTTGFFIYSPTGGYTGSDSLTFNVTANSETSSNATLSLTVTNAKTRIIDTLLNPDGSFVSGKVTFILTQKVNSPAGVIPVSSSVSSVLNSSGQFDVSVYPSSALSPQAFYQVWFESSTSKRELLGVYSIPASNATITLAAHQVTNTNLAAQYVFLSAAAINSILSGGAGAGVTTFEGRNGTVVSASGDYTASEITNTPAGNIAATNVQTALNELDSEKVQTGSNASLLSVSTVAGSTAAPGNTPTGSTRFTLYDGSGVTNGEYMASGVESNAWWLNNLAAGKFNFYFGAVKKFDFSASAFTPTTDNVFEFGGASNRIKNIFLSGGINVGSDATGDSYYRNSSGNLARRAIGTEGKCYMVVSGLPDWADCPSGSGSGTVTSVGLSVPSMFSVSGSPVTTSGTLALSYTPTYSPATITSNQNNYAGLTGQAYVIRLSADGDYDVTGITAPSGVELHLVTNISSTETLTFKNQSGSSSAANRIITSGGGDIVLRPGEIMMLTYDDSSGRWRASKTNTIGIDVQAFDADLSSLASASGTSTIYYRSASNTWSAVTIGSGLTFTSGTLSATGGGGGATTALDNLASVAVNTSLISDTDNTDDLGSSSIRWKEVHSVKTLASTFQSPSTITINAQGANTLFSGDLASGSYSTLMSFQGSTLTLQGKVMVKTGYGILSGNARLEALAASDSEVAFIANSAASPTADILQVQLNSANAFTINKLGQIVGTEISSNPTTSELSSLNKFAVYMKGDKFIIAFNNAGTITYIYIPMDGSTTTWTQTTTAP